MGCNCGGGGVSYQVKDLAGRVVSTERTLAAAYAKAQTEKAQSGRDHTVNPIRGK